MNQATEGAGPLDGVRVIEFVGIGPGPFAAMMLSDLGADVVRIDRAGGQLSLVRPESDIMGRGRPSLAVNLKDPDEVARVQALIAQADILIEGFRPGVMERLGLGPQECWQDNPGLVYGRITGWGQKGPLAQTAGHDLNYLAVSGVLDGLGRAGQPPTFPINLLGDFAGGSLYLVAGVLAALTYARSTGKGQVVDAAIVDGAAHLSAMTISMVNEGVWSNERGTNLLDSGAPFYEVYATADDQWVSLAALEPQFWNTFLEILTCQQHLTEDEAAEFTTMRFEQSRWPELLSRLTSLFMAQPQAYWAELFTGTDACVAPVNNFAQARRDPHLLERGTYVGDEAFQPAPAPRFSLFPQRIPTAGRAPGADNESTLPRWRP